MTMLIKPAVLFDLDGTLVDTADDLGAALNHVLKQHAMPLLTPEQYRPVASHGARGLLEAGFGSALASHDFAELRNQLLSYYNEHVVVHSDLFAGGHALLKNLAQQQITWGIVTNKPYRLAARIVRQLPALHDCQILIGGDSLSVRKPDPTPLLVAAHQLRTPAKHCWYLGDAQRDIEAGLRAGMTTVLCEFGYIGPADMPTTWGAHHHIASLDALLSLWQC